MATNAEVAAKQAAHHSPSAPRRRETSLVAQVTSLLRDDIIRGVFTPGDRLMETTLSTHYGVSRVPVREALRVLEGEGFVASHGTGTRTVARLDDRDAQDLFAVRATVEGLTAHHAAELHTPAQLRVIRSILLEGRGAATAGATPDVFAELNASFHRAIAEASGSNSLVSLYDQISGKLAWAYRGNLRITPRPSWQDHAEIVEALAAGDGEAARTLMVAHVEKARREVLTRQTSEPEN